jgi:hypothetical protein
MIAPLARTPAEAHLYMDVKPCPRCGGHGFSGTSVVMLQDGVVYERHTGTCQECGCAREFVFRVPQEPELRLGAADFGGPEPSELLDPGEWLLVADLAAAREGGAAREDLALAAAAVEEALKFVPAGADDIPAPSFHSSTGRDAYAREPARFRRARLEALAAALREEAAAPLRTPVDPG